MVYNHGGGRRGGFGGGRGRGRGQSQGGQLCRKYLDGNCDFEQVKGRPCGFVHLLKKIGETKGHNGAVKDVVMWGANQQLFTCAADANIKLWDCVSWNELTNLSVQDEAPTSQSSSNRNNNRGRGGRGNYSKENKEGVTSMVLAGPLLFAGFEGKYPSNPTLGVGRIRGWNLESPQQPPYEFQVGESMPFAHKASVLSLAVATDKNGAATLFSGSSDGTIRYWQLDTTSNTFQCRGHLEGHVRGVTRLKTFVLGETPILASASVDTTIRLWDLSTYACVKTLSKVDGNGHTDAVMDLEFWVNQSETFLISGGLDSQVIVWSLAPPFQQMFQETMDNQVTSLCGAQDPNQTPILLVGTSDGGITIKELPSFAYKGVLSNTFNVGHMDAVRRISLGPLNTFFSVSNDRKMIAWQITGDVASVPTK